MIFDGRQFAKEIEQRVKTRVEGMKRKPKIVSILVGKDPASELYTRLKKEAAKRVGIEFEVRRMKEGGTKEEIFEELRLIGDRNDVTGVMVQIPIPGLTRIEMEEVVTAIPLHKDVDGLRWQESEKEPATVRAIIAILERIDNYRSSDPSFIPLMAGLQTAGGSELWTKRFVVVGSHGSVGKPLIHFLEMREVREVREVNSQTEGKTEILRSAEVVISCVGKEGVVTGEMVSEGVIAVDVGSPKGDMTGEVYEKVRVAVPVPGGVGPVTVASLMENAAEVVEYAAYERM